MENVYHQAGWQMNDSDLGELCKEVVMTYLKHYPEICLEDWENNR
jgi:hypothetical protein